MKSWRLAEWRRPRISGPAIGFGLWALSFVLLTFFAAEVLAVLAFALGGLPLAYALSSRAAEERDATAEGRLPRRAERR